MTATTSAARGAGRRRGRARRTLGASLALCALLAACGFGGDDKNCVYGEAVEACALRVLGEEASVDETDAFFARRGFVKDPRVVQAGEGAIHVYGRDEPGGRRTVFMVATFNGDAALVGLQTSTRRN